MPSESSRKIREPRWPVGLVAWRKAVELIIRQLCRASGLQIEISNSKRSHGSDGDALTFEVPGSGVGTGAGAPLTVNDDGTVVFGTILGAIPTIDGDPIHESPALTLPGSGTHYIVATVSGTPNTSTLSGRVYTHSLSSIDVEISVESSDPGSGGLVSSTGDYAFVLATIVGGVISQNGIGPITGGVDDILDGTGAANLILIYPQQ